MSDVTSPLTPLEGNLDIPIGLARNFMTTWHLDPRITAGHSLTRTLFKT